MKEEHPIVKKARLEAERAIRKADKARDKFFDVLRIQGTILIIFTTAVLIILNVLNN